MTYINENATALAQTDQLSREDWLQFRRLGIGGSDVAAILGKSKYKSAYALWADKTGLVPVQENGNEATQWGHDLELPIAKAFAREYNNSVVAVPYLLRSKRHPFMLANLDFVIVETTEEFPVGEVTHFDGYFEDLPYIQAILEIKTSGIASRGNPEAWDDGNVPEAYVLQGQHYSIVTGCEYVVFAALVGGRGLKVAGRLYNSEEQNAELIAKEEEFWTSVQLGRAPEVDGSESTTETLKALYPKSEALPKEVDDVVAQLVDDYQTFKEASDYANKHLKTVRNRLEAIFGEADELVYNGQTIATYRSTKDSEVIDTDALVEWAESVQTGVTSQFRKAKSGYRVLRIK